MAKIQVGVKPTKQSFNTWDIVQVFEWKAMEWMEKM